MTPDELGDVIRGLLYTATGREETADETIPLGAAIGTCNATEAAQFAQNVDDWTANRSSATNKQGNQT